MLVPTKELTQQAVRNIRELASCCGEGMKVVALAGDQSLKAQR